MAAKLLHSLADENPDLQKQIGCMSGIFQMFDRQQMIVSGRRIADQSHSHRRTLPRQSNFSNGSLEEDYINTYQRQPTEMNANKTASERQRLSTESSRASFSSSRSSSFSSVDYSRGTQPDPAYNDRITYSEAALEDSHRSISPRISRQSAEFRGTVKDSMIKEARGLSIKTTNREENMSRAVKQRDTLMDLNIDKSVDGARPRTNDNQNVRDNLKESIKVLSKLQGSSWPYNEPKEQQRLSDYGYRSKEASRISYDGNETSRFSFDSRETLSASKLKDLPRLSLDSRECLTRQADCDSSSNSRLDASLKRSCSTKEMGQNLREVLGSQQPRPPSLVAKLMGLSALPDPALASRKDMGLVKTQCEFDASVLGKPILDSKPPSPKKEPDSPRWVTSDMKPISSSRIHVEPAPWKNQDRGVSLLKQSSRRIRSPTRQSNPFPSVYSEIEKRFKDIEFNQSGKDLRALKQILESIHAKGLLEDEKLAHASTVATSRKQESKSIKAKQKSASLGQQNARGEQLTAVIPRHDKSSRPLDSPIVIMKPICRLPRNQTTKNVYKDHAVSSNEKSKSAQLAGRPQQQPKDNSASSPRNLGPISPRTRLKKLESEKQNQFPSHSSDANRHRVQVSKQPNESSSPGGLARSKSSSIQHNSSQISEILLEIKKLRSQTNDAPFPADRNVTQDSKRDKEATCSARSNKVNGSHSPSKRASKQAVLASNQLSNHINLPVQLDETAPEHPSPVSVLNNSPYMDDLETEEKRSTTPPEDFAEGYTAYKSNLRSELNVTSEISRKKLLSIDSLVQKLKRLNSTHDESRTDYIALLCDNTNPDHRYISEILLASGLLLREFGSSAKPFQLHPSGNLINPELFNVLEQTKSSAHISKINHKDISANADESKSHRKLIFDAVNEILINKLSSNGNLADYTVKHYKLAKKVLNKKNLIKELCTEMEQFQPKKTKKNKQECKFGDEEDENDGAVKDLLWEDVMHRSSDSWSGFESEISEVVLDIERSLFKNLVNEIVISDAVSYRLRPKSGTGSSHKQNRSGL
ncbi:unnamed protein product [Rhodiola kirilowii]